MAELLELDKLYCGDNVHLMRQMEDNSVHLTVTSPPYDEMRTYNGYSFDFPNVVKELYRITVPGGIVVWVVGDATVKGSETGTSFRQALGFTDAGFWRHDTMIWHKTNPVPTQHTRYQASFEYMFVFSKGKPKTTNLLHEPSKTPGNVHKKHRARKGAHERNDDGFYISKDTKLRHNVWDMATAISRGEFKHPAVFPDQLAHDHILSWSNEGDVVLDPFVGSGTTPKMARILNRKFIGIDISQEYIDLANPKVFSVT